MAKVNYLNWIKLLNAGATGFVVPDNELSAMKNCYEYKVGELKKVPGYEKYVTSAVVSSEDVTSLMNNDGVIVAACDSGSDLVLKYKASGSAWTTISTSTFFSGDAEVKLQGEMFLEKLFIVGTNGEVNPCLIDGTTFSSTDTDLTNMPREKYIKEYKSRLYVGGFDNNLTFSSEVESGAITWTPTTDYFEVGTSEDSIKGLSVMFNKLIIFKGHSMWSWDGTSLIEIAKVGCKSNQSIQAIGSALYWINNDGIYKWSGGEPMLISKKVQPFLDKIVSESFLRSTMSCVYNLEYRVYIRTVTVDGYEYTNTQLCFDTIKEKWYIRCTGHNVTSMIMYTPFEGQVTLFGSSDGYVYKMANDGDDEDNEGFNSDAGEPIDSFFITHNLDHGSPTTVNVNPEITVFSGNPMGLKMAIQIDDNGVFDQDNVSILKKNVEEIQLKATGHRFKYKFYEVSESKPWRFEGFVVDVKEREDRR